MPLTVHTEKHFTAGAAVRDVVIGMSDGLTVPFALAAGLSGAVSSTRIVVTAGLAEILAGAIAMGLGGYLAARGDAEHYANERAREAREILEVPDEERAEVAKVLRSFGLGEKQAAIVVDALSDNPEEWVEFMMRFELGLEKPDPHRALQSAATIGTAYVVGGLVPLAPYFFFDEASRALWVSASFTLLALAVFGALKGRATGTPALKSGIQTTVIGALAATAAFLLASWIS